MLDFLKKLIVSNKYSLLVLLILSLWLKLAKDYSIILSYIVLIILYLIIGMIVSFVLDSLQENNKKKEISENEKKPSRRNIVTKPSQTEHREPKREVQPVAHSVQSRTPQGSRVTPQSRTPSSTQWPRA